MAIVRRIPPWDERDEDAPYRYWGHDRPEKPRYPWKLGAELSWHYRRELQLGERSVVELPTASLVLSLGHERLWAAYEIRALEGLGNALLERSGRAASLLAELGWRSNGWNAHAVLAGAKQRAADLASRLAR